MKFGAKVAVVNILLIAVAFSLSGFFLIRRNHQTALQEQTAAAVRENKLICAMLESETVNRLLRGDTVDAAGLAETAADISDSVEDEDTVFCLFDSAGKTLYGPDGINGALLQKRQTGERSALVERTGKDVYGLSVSGVFSVNDDAYYVVNKKDISQTYRDRASQVQYFQLLLLIVVAGVGALSAASAYYLTRPIITLNRSADKIAAGNYHVRAKVESLDEIGALAGKFNVMAASIERHVDEVKEEGRRKDEFVANFTHEIKTPLTSVIGYADLIRSRELPAQERIKAANYIFREGARLEQMSMKLFDLLLADKEKIELRSLSVRQLLASVQESVLPSLQEAGMKLHIQADPVRLRGEPDLLRTVLINLIDNARKAGARGQIIMLKAFRREDSVVIEVTDQGCGIEKENIPRLTEAFFMVDKSRSRLNGGAGIGLSLAARILSRHDARLEIESEPGVGTTMRLFFPVKGETA